MKVKHSDEIVNPLQTPSGEIVYELIGRTGTEGNPPSHSLARIVIPPGKSSAPHYHQASQETYYVLEGVGKMRVDQAGFNLHPGQACWIEPGEVHQISNDGAYDLVFLAVCVPAWVPEDSFGV